MCLYLYNSAPLTFAAVYFVFCILRTAQASAEFYRYHAGFDTVFTESHIWGEPEW